MWINKILNFTHFFGRNSPPTLNHNFEWQSHRIIDRTDRLLKYFISSWPNHSRIWFFLIQSRTVLTSSAYAVEKIKEAFILLVCLLDHSLPGARHWYPTLDPQALHPSLWKNEMEGRISENISPCDSSVSHPDTGFGSEAVSSKLTEPMDITAPNTTEMLRGSDVLQLFLEALFQPVLCAQCIQLNAKLEANSYYGLNAALLGQPHSDPFENVHSSQPGKLISFLVSCPTLARKIQQNCYNQGKKKPIQSNFRFPLGQWALYFYRQKSSGQEEIEHTCELSAAYEMLLIATSQNAAVREFTL